MTDYPHVPAAFINAIAEEGAKAEAIEYLQKQWNENCALRAELNKALREIADLRMPISGVAQAPTKPGQDEWKSRFLDAIKALHNALDVIEAIDSECLLPGQLKDLVDETLAPRLASSLPSTNRVCAKCGCETMGEEAFVNGGIWCHPCADGCSFPSTNCTCAALGKKNIPHARNCPAVSPADQGGAST